MIRNCRLQAFALALLVALPACESRTEEETLPADTTAGMMGDTVPTVTLEPVVTELDAVNNSGVSGEATATHTETDVAVSIVLKGDNAKPDVSYPAHIHTGTCEKGGPVAVTLEPVKNLQSLKRVPVSELPANQDAFVQVHDAAGTPVACGDLKGHDANTGRMGTDTAHATTGY